MARITQIVGYTRITSRRKKLHGQYAQQRPVAGRLCPCPPDSLYGRAGAVAQRCRKLCPDGLDKVFQKSVLIFGTVV